MIVVEPGIDAIVEFARLILQTAPFCMDRSMPANWELALRAWLQDHPATQVIALGAEDGVKLLQDALTYRLPWAMEAVRVYGIAIGQPGAELLQGLAPTAVETGSANRSIISLLRAGLSSREAAAAAVTTTGAAFIDRDGMMEWLNSEEVKHLGNQPDWPTLRCRQSWLQFVDVEKTGRRRK